MTAPLVVVREPWRPAPLAWIHRAEARAIARELGAPMVDSRDPIPPANALLRLSDPVMRQVVSEMRQAYSGPGSAALERCFDKYEAQCIVAAGGVEAPRTWLANDAELPPAPFVLKPRRGSDSIGVRIADSVPAHKRNADHLVQERVLGDEMTVAVFRGATGVPLRIFLPEGTPYTFLRKYVLRPVRAPVVADAVRNAAARVAQLLGVDWAARVDFIVESGTGRVCFLECDAAPMVGPDSAFAASFAAAGVDRAHQLRWLTGDYAANASFSSR